MTLKTSGSTITGTTSSFDSGTLSVTNSSTTTQTMITALAGSIAAGQTNTILLGRSAGTYMSGLLAFTCNSLTPSANSNTISLSLYGSSAGFLVDGAGNTATQGVSHVFGPSAAPTVNTAISIQNTASSQILLAQVGLVGNYSTTAVVGDSVIRTSGNLILQNGGGASALRITSSNNVEVRNNLNIISLTASYSVHTDSSKNLVSVQNNGTGLNILQTSPTLITPNIGVATGTSLQAVANTPITTQGLHLQWNRSGGSGESWIINQKGGGSTAGIRFGESTAANVITEIMNLTTTNAAFSGNITPNGLSTSSSVFTNASKTLVSRPGFSHQFWTATANTAAPNNFWSLMQNMTKTRNGGNGELVQWTGSAASFRNDNGTSMLFVCSFTTRPVGTGISSWAMQISCGGNTLAQTEVNAGRNEISISATGVISASQTLEFYVNQYTGFGQNAEGVRICITTYPLL